MANSIVPLDQIVGGGPPRDGIPSIDPKFVSAQEANEFIEDVEFVLGLNINGDIHVTLVRSSRYLIHLLLVLHLLLPYFSHLQF